MTINAADAVYREVFLTPVRVCANYRPAFGTAKNAEEISLPKFQQLFAADPLYAWLGLDSPLMYAAHKAAGGMTSIYRQIGIGCERLVRAVIRDTLLLSEAEVAWGYDSIRTDGKSQRLVLDARIDTNHLSDAEASARVTEWLASASVKINQHRDVSGAVFEVRQGYKSADSKRQNADLRFGLASYDAGYLPVIMVISTQVSQGVIARYRQNKLMVLTGTMDNNPTTSTYAFFDQVVGYSLANFFERNSVTIKSEVEAILQSLLTA